MAMSSRVCNSALSSKAALDQTRTLASDRYQAPIQQLETQFYKSKKIPSTPMFELEGMGIGVVFTLGRRSHVLCAIGPSGQGLNLFLQN